MQALELVSAGKSSSYLNVENAATEADVVASDASDVGHTTADDDDDGSDTATETGSGSDTETETNSAPPPHRSVLSRPPPQCETTNPPLTAKSSSLTRDGCSQQRLANANIRLPRGIPGIINENTSNAPTTRDVVNNSKPVKSEPNDSASAEINPLRRLRQNPLVFNR